MCLVLDVQSQETQQYSLFPAPVRSKTVQCPVCRSSTVNGIELLPISFVSLEKAIELKKASAKGNHQGRNHGRDEMSDFYAESTYMVLANSRGSSSGTKISDQEQQRTGRWTEEEIAYVDFLVSSFDKGRLPLPHGIKLNEFLGDILLCKSSRLTKKMKNAKLSTRSFVLSRPESSSIRSDCAVLSALQEKFLMSIPSKATQLELRFNIVKQWRTHFSNLCVQVGYPFLDSTNWVAGLEEMDRRASRVEENARKVRRRQMGIALQTDGGARANPSVFISGIKADAVTSNTSMEPFLPDNNRQKRRRLLSVSEEDGPFPGGKAEDFFPTLNTSLESNMSPLLQSQPTDRARSFSEDFDAVLSDLMDQEEAPQPVSMTSHSTESVSSERNSTSSPSPSSCGPFLEAVTHYMETSNSPFQHVDVWVPSFLPRDSDGPSKAVDMEKLRLFHAGYSTRGDIDSSLAYALNEFGVYSENFSFEPGHGLPGNVYSSGKASWASYLDECDPKVFERTGGAKIYGLKTALGIPLKTPMVGLIVVVLYSTVVLNEDWRLAQQCATELVRLCPEPKWKLIIDTKESNVATGTTRPPSTILGTLHESSSQLSMASSRPGTTSAEEEERSIVSLLGEHMPLHENPAGDISTGSTMLPHFMSMRLTLLRPASRRSPQENDMVEIVKNSFRAYSKDNRRTGGELALLLAKDWVCLKQSMGASFAAPSQSPLAQPMRRDSFTVPSPHSTLTGVSPSSLSVMKTSSQFEPPRPPMLTYDHRPNQRTPSFGEGNQTSRRLSVASDSSAASFLKPRPIRSSNIGLAQDPQVVTPNIISEG
ncbi:unnamed protein product [Cylindrotheca closterium]|uniref:Transcription factor MYC/MYB N-terminal domain-containing protein n=1 Tax=Cylindrotheca closterium TaxID=2856 RepID=A0AAD2CBA4_9STRA|nr:unnamed protein product [Cylindrotheca closterium]